MSPETADTIRHAADAVQWLNLAVSVVVLLALLGALARWPQNWRLIVLPTNVPVADGAVITLSPLRNLTAGHMYRVEVKYTIAGNVLESYFYVQAEA